MMRSIVCGAIFATIAACVFLPLHSRAEFSAMPHVYVIEYKPGSAWRAGVPMNKQALGPHAAYWKNLAAEGRAIAAGPYREIDGGMAIVTAATFDEARAIVASDPAVSSNVFVAQLHEWSPLIRGVADLPRPESR
jgi:uncharacterized protein YciI